MSAQSSIQWTDRTWNPVRGCSVVSPGCVNCYAMKQAHRFSGPGKPYEGLTKLTQAGPQWTGVVRTVEHALLEPLSWRKPQRVFVNSMSDLFHEDVPFEFIDRVFAVMGRCEHHTFQILTKRAARMRQYMTSRPASLTVPGEITIATESGLGVYHVRWPLPNVWLGVSVENQKYADERIPLLLQTPAAVRFISAEPLLGPTDLSRWMWPLCWHWAAGYKSPEAALAAGAYAEQKMQALVSAHARFLDWVIVGGESGPGARPFDIAWARSIVAQCKAAGVAVFVKQLGSQPNYQRPRVTLAAGAGVECQHGYDVCPRCDAGTVPLSDRKGGDIDEWPVDLRVREFPS